MQQFIVKERNIHAPQTERKHLFSVVSTFIKVGWVARSAPPQRPQRKGFPTGGWVERGRTGEHSVRGPILKKYGPDGKKEASK